MRRDPLSAVFRQGFCSKLLNPKIAVLIVAFLPQFVEQGAPNQAMRLLLLGFPFNLIGTLWNLGAACSAGRLTEPLRRRLDHRRHLASMTRPLMVDNSYREATSMWSALSRSHESAPPRDRCR
ncbi:MAG: hypothetical protein C0505_02855 [Leptothrix sp. (in: Bacteria)]|nr:hypothetical protein [Leptothrix sp. (in: b-proteobacteria)]